MTRLTVYRDTVTADGTVYQCTGVRGKSHHFTTVSHGDRKAQFHIKRSRRWPFGPVLRNHTIDLFRGLAK